MQLCTNWNSFGYSTELFFNSNRKKWYMFTYVLFGISITSGEIFWKDSRFAVVPFIFWNLSLRMPVFCAICTSFRSIKIRALSGKQTSMFLLHGTSRTNFAFRSRPPKFTQTSWPTCRNRWPWFSVRLWASCLSFSSFIWSASTVQIGAPAWRSPCLKPALVNRFKILISESCSRNAGILTNLSQLFTVLCQTCNFFCAEYLRKRRTPQFDMSVVRLLVAVMMFSEAFKFGGGAWCGSKVSLLWLVAIFINCRVIGCDTKQCSISLQFHKL